MSACEMINVVYNGEDSEEQVCGKPATHRLEGGHLACAACGSPAPEPPVSIPQDTVGEEKP